MIHFEDAEAAFTAVMGTSRLPSLPIFTLLAVLHFHMLALEGWCHALRDDAGVSEGCSDVSQVSSKAEAIENHAVEYAFER